MNWCGRNVLQRHHRIENKVQLVSRYNTSPIAIGRTPIEGFVIKRNEYIMLSEGIIGNLE
jgi:hypothetical protein